MNLSPGHRFSLEKYFLDNMSESFRICVFSEKKMTFFFNPVYFLLSKNSNLACQFFFLIGTNRQ